MSNLNPDDEPTSLPPDVRSAPSSIETQESRSKASPKEISGKYKLINPIGEGGMGTVWLAEQRHPVKRLVAIKLIKSGMDTKAVLARFEAERQALAMMDHPNIARILDGGIAETGSPFFVMELVKGVPINEFCDARKLSLKERLELFVPVCQAIQHAHQKGIIHRDIKPSNILVALYDDKPVPKVIDFGVAKATGQSLTEQTLITGFGVVGTPQYMSPEQATLNQLDIDTRSDIYSLGVLLYELLTGSPPFKLKDLQQAGYMEVLRVIREVEPPRPSTKISTADALPDIARTRSTDPKRLAGVLRSELDWIVMKSIEKDRARRYETANAFASDVERYLHGEPVRAHPPSTAYRLRKFVRKNRGPVLAALLVFVALTAGMVGTTLALFEANRQTAKAKSAALQALESYRLMTDESVESLIGERIAYGPLEKKFMRQVVDRWLKFAEQQSDDDEGKSIRAEGLYRAAKILERLERETAFKYAQDAYEIRSALADQTPDSLQRFLERVEAFALTDTAANSTDGCKEILDLIVQKIEDAPKDADLQSWASVFHQRLAFGAYDRGDFEKVRVNAREAIRYQRAAYELSSRAPKHASGLGSALVESNVMLGYDANDCRLAPEELAEECFSYHKEACQITEQIVLKEPDNPGYLNDFCRSLQCTGDLFFFRSRQEEAEAWLQKAVSHARDLYKRFPGYPNAQSMLAMCLNDYSESLEQSGKDFSTERWATIEADAAEAVKLMNDLETRFPEMSYLGPVVMRINLVRIKLRVKKPEEAISLVKYSLAFLDEAIPKLGLFDGNKHKCDQYFLEAKARTQLGQMDLATECYVKGLAVFRETPLEETKEDTRTYLAKKYREVFDEAMTFLEAHGRASEAAQEKKNLEDFLNKLGKPSLTSDGNGRSTGSSVPM